MPTAYLMIRHEPQYRRGSFEQGLRAAGYTVEGTPRIDPRPGDILVIWNRYGRFDAIARTFEQARCAVVVAENGGLGREMGGEFWYSLTLTNPLAGGIWPDGDAARWDSLGVNICEWRKDGTEVIILAQRGIGPHGVRQPDGWATQAANTLHAAGYPVRIRQHPGENKPATTLEADLANAQCVVTWASGAALKALLWGIPVIHGYREWIARDAASLLSGPKLTLSRPERLPTFRRLAWSMWRIPEIAAGLPFHHLLGSQSFRLETTIART